MKASKSGAKFKAGEPGRLIIHYTAGGSADNTVRFFAGAQAQASAHLVIGRDGAVTQMVDFDTVAWHAGRSHWKGLDGLNRYSIGFELANWGMLTGHSGAWRSWTGASVPDDRVREARHMNGGPVCGWEIFPEAQIEAALAAAAAVVQGYDMVEVLGHDEIARGRKIDPGPAFPMDSFRARVLGRAEDAPDELVVTASALNIRTDPDLGAAKLEESPLKRGTRVLVTGFDGPWRLVHALDASGEPHVTGWVHGDFIA